MTTTTGGDNKTLNEQQVDSKTILAPLTKKIGQLEKSNNQLNTKVEQLENSMGQLNEQILRLEITQTENLNELRASFQKFLKQLADTLNSKQSSNLEPTLQSLTEALQMVGFEVREQRSSQTELTDKIQQLLTAQQVMKVLNSEALMTNEPPDNS